eukprot:11198903-Lingulodinium_polyedra.AAC.1
MNAKRNCCCHSGAKELAACGRRSRCLCTCFACPCLFLSAQALGVSWLGVAVGPVESGRVP